MPETGVNESGSTGAAAVLQTHLEHLERPLRYATRQNFAHLAKLRDLEAYVQHHVQALQASPLPPGLLPLLQQLLQAVQDIDTLPLLQKRERVRQAELLLAQMRVRTSHDAEPSPATSAVQAPARATTGPVFRARDQGKPAPWYRRVETRMIRAPSLCNSCVALAPDARRCSPKCHSTRYTISCGAFRYATRTAASSRL